MQPVNVDGGFAVTVTVPDQAFENTPVGEAAPVATAKIVVLVY